MSPGEATCGDGDGGDPAAHPAPDVTAAVEEAEVVSQLSLELWPEGSSDHGDDPG